MTDSNAFDILNDLIAKAQAILPLSGNKIGIVLAPNNFVFQSFNQVWFREYGCAPKGDHVACMAVRGVIVLGVDLPKKSPLHNHITIWADSQFRPPAHDAQDQDDHPHHCPIFRPCPNGDEFPLERALWDIQMADWVGYVGPTIHHMLTQEPALSAELGFIPPTPPP